MLVALSRTQCYHYKCPPSRPREGAPMALWGEASLLSGTDLTIQQRASVWAFMVTKTNGVVQKFIAHK